MTRHMYARAVDCAMLATEQACHFSFYQTLALWLDEPRLHDPSLYLPALPLPYDPRRLEVVLKGNKVGGMPNSARTVWLLHDVLGLDRQSGILRSWTKTRAPAFFLHPCSLSTCIYHHHHSHPPTYPSPSSPPPPPVPYRPSHIKPNKDEWLPPSKLHEGIRRSKGQRGSCSYEDGDVGVWLARPSRFRPGLIVLRTTGRMFALMSEATQSYRLKSHKLSAVYPFSSGAVV